MTTMPLNLADFLETMFANQAAILDKDDAPEEPQCSFNKDNENVWTLIHRGNILGWVNRVTGDHKYRALSAVTNNIQYFYSLDNARNYLFEQSH